MTPDQLRELRRLRDEGHSYGDIADRMRLTYEQVRYALQNKPWKRPSGAPIDFSAMYRRIADRAERKKP